MRRTIATLAFATVFLFCAAWGATGHKIVAQIAYDHLTPKARAEVDKLLAGSSLAEFSVWADQIKSDPKWAWSKPWHFADMEPDAKSFSMDHDCPANGCVVKGIQKYTAVLASGSAKQEEKVEALKFLVHFVGDIHQPLHVGNKSDKGGNGIEVQLFSRKTNLHSVWDDGIIKRRGMDFEVYTRKLEEGLTPEKRKVFVAVMDPIAWATESHDLAQKDAYRSKGQHIKSGDTLGDEYCDHSQPIVDEQLTKAGLRLAAMLNKIYDPTGTLPTAVRPETAPTATTPTAPPKPSVPTKPAVGVKFVGSRNSQVYHLPGCSAVKTIKPENLVEYAEAPEGKRLHEGCPK